ADVATYLRLFTDVPSEEVIDLLDAPPEQRAAQRRLAHDVTATVHGQGAVDAAERASAALFGGDPTTLSEDELLSVFGDAPSTDLPRSILDGGRLLVDLAAEVGLAPSKSASRLSVIEVVLYVNNREERDPDRVVRDEHLLAGRYML